MSGNKENCWLNEQKAFFYKGLYLWNPYKAVTSYYISCESGNCFYEVPKLISRACPGVKWCHYSRPCHQATRRFRLRMRTSRLKSLKRTWVSGPVSRNGAAMCQLRLSRSKCNRFYVFATRSCWYLVTASTFSNSIGTNWRLDNSHYH